MYRKAELTALGYAGLIPFAAGAALVWAAPAAPPGVPLDGELIARVTLLYGGIIAAYMAGAGAGSLIAAEKPAAQPLAPGMIAARAAWGALFPAPLWIPGAVGEALRFIVVIAALLCLLILDLGAARAGVTPSWYGPLRIRLTTGATLCLALIALRILI